MQRVMIWLHPLEEEGRILIEGSVIDLVSHYRQQETKTPEAGGILLGYRRDTHLHVVSATPPQQGDRRARHCFHRRDPLHHMTAVDQWKSSGSTIDYLGEWHTHPEGDPSPSSLDISEWRKICRTRQECMVFLIVGNVGKLWLGIGQGHNIQVADNGVDDR